MKDKPIVIKIHREIWSPSAKFDPKDLEERSDGLFQYIDNSRIDGQPIFKFNRPSQRTVKVKHILDINDEFSKFKNKSLKDIFVHYMGYDTRIDLVTMLEDHFPNMSSPLTTGYLQK